MWESVVSDPQTILEGQIYSAMVAIDVIVGYGWMAIVIALLSALMIFLYVRYTRRRIRSG